MPFHLQNGSSTVRMLKASMVGSVGLWALLVAINNVADYQSNWLFVQHVMTMDTVFPDNALKHRAVTDHRLHTVAYLSIIAVEWAMSALCLLGAVKLFRNRSSAADFARAVPTAACGLTLVFLLYFVGFVAIGGEWFCMWQSTLWNGQGKAVMFVTCAMLVLVVLLQREAR